VTALVISHPKMRFQFGPCLESY